MFSLLFSAFCCTDKKLKHPIYRHFRAIRTKKLDYCNNIVLAKDGVNIVFENSVDNIRKNAFHISFFSNLEI